MTTINSYCRSIGIKVEYESIPHEWAWADFQNRSIHVHDELDEDTQSCLISHELGHLLLGHNKQYDEVEEVIIEVEAWQFAKNINNTLQLGIPKKLMDDVMKICLKTFISS